MRFIVPVFLAIIISLCTGCAPIDTIAYHGFNSGNYTLKSPGTSPSKVYLDIARDSIAVYNIKEEEGAEKPDPASGKAINIGSIEPGSYLYGSKFSKISIDVDLSTVLTKVRPATGGVPLQANTTLNGLIYIGAKKDYFSIITHKSLLNRTKSLIRHYGFDAGFFAGFGSTSVTPTTTNFNTTLEYDGVVFQKGIAAFITLENLSVGIGLGFDNLMDSNSKYWVYNQKPWIGLVLGIANF